MKIADQLQKAVEGLSPTAIAGKAKISRTLVYHREGSNYSSPARAKNINKMKAIKERIANRLNVPVGNIIIHNVEHRENADGKRLEPGSPVYFISELGVEDGENSKEWCGWVINDKFYCEIG